MGLLQNLTRRKALASVLSEPTELGRVLSTFDLVALGVGCTLGVGVYVLPGVVAKDIAGPGVVLSFFYAAVASVLAGFCYAEFGAKVPKAGSAYIYSYVTVGEFVAFVIGWNLIIEYIIGGASVARGVSMYMDSLIDNEMTIFFRQNFPLNNPFFAEYVDLFALAISVLICLGLAIGVKESLTVNNLLSTINCAIVLFVIMCGMFYVDIDNWKLPSGSIPSGYGLGGFLPYGILGTFKGASTCFYGFVGFDVIATSGEEARNPQRSIPIAIIVSLLISFVAYSGLSSVLTLMWPYYLQDVNAPLPYVFYELDLQWAKWLVTVGGLVGLTASLFGGLFPLPRVIYAMSQDGLLFPCLGAIHQKFKTPFVGTIVSGLITGIMGAMFPLKGLVDLMSMATLACYTIVAMSVLILRYGQEEIRYEIPSDAKPLLTRRAILKHSTRVIRVPVMVYILTLTCALLAFSLVHLANQDNPPDIWTWPFFCVLFLIVILLILACFCGMPSSSSNITFNMPGLPFTPTLSIFFNLYLMFLMDLNTWIHFLLWMIAGLSIYFGYGLKHSKENKKLRVEYEQLNISE